MVALSALWIPVLLSAVIVFLASSVMHMLLPYHRNDYHQLPEEDKIRAAVRTAGLRPGLYMFPYSTPKEMKSPVTLDKFREGPVGILTIFPNGPIAMPKLLGLWFVYSLLISFFVAYLTGHTVTAGANYLSGFRVAGPQRSWPMVREYQQRHLERSAVVDGDEGTIRWTRVRASDCRHVWLALAALEQKARDSEIRLRVRCGQRIAFSELPLVPVRIDRRALARCVEPCDLFFGEIPADRAQILP